MSDMDKSSVEDGSPKWSRLVVFGIAEVLLAMCTSLQGPFFPKMAEINQLPSSVIGWVFGSYQISGFISSFMLGSLLRRLNHKWSLLLGLFLKMAVYFLMGVLFKEENVQQFLLYSILLRVWEGVGDSFFFIGIMTEMSVDVPKLVSTARGMTSLFTEIGLMTGPALAGIMINCGVTSVGNVFVMFSCICLVYFVFLCFMSCCNGNDHVPVLEKDQTLDQPIEKEAMTLGFLCIVATSITAAFFRSMLALFLQDFELSAMFYAAFFFFPAIWHGLSAPLLGMHIDKGGDLYSGIFFFGFLSIFWLIFTSIPFDKVVVLLSLCVLGTCHAALWSLGYSKYIRAYFAAGHPNEPSTVSLVSGHLHGAKMASSFLGALAGGYLYGLFGFSKSCLCYIFPYALLLVYLSYICRKSKNRNAVFHDVGFGLPYRLLYYNTF